MNLKKIAAAVISAAALSSTAFAAPTITNVDGTLSPFGGFDWASGGAAFTSGFTAVAGSTFTLYYASWAGLITDTTGGSLYAPKLDTNPNGTPITTGAYEYTIFGTIQEKVVSCTLNTCTFQVTGGAFDIYYDTTANAKTVSNGAWTGFTNGTKILSGTVNVGGASQSFSNTTGGQAALDGTVTYTNSTYVNPAMVGTNLTSTLQLSTAVTNFSPPTSIDGTTVGANQIVFQADSNQTFTGRVPEPAGLALVGLALAGCGLMSRRRKAA